MKKAGEILKKERLKKGLRLSEISKKTKIKKKFLEAIEKGDYDILGGAGYAFGLVGTYSTFLNLNKKEIEAFLRREIKENTDRILPKLDEEEGGLFGGRLPTILGILTFSLIIAGVGFYIFVQSREFLLTPKIEVFSPENKLVTNKDYVVVSGKVDSGTTVFINSQEVNVLESGEFNQRVNLFSGINKIEIKAVNMSGKEGVVKREIIKRKE